MIALPERSIPLLVLTKGGGIGYHIVDIIDSIRQQ